MAEPMGNKARGLFVAVVQTDDFNPNATPTNAMEYLQKVQLERYHCPEVVTADLSKKKFKGRQTVFVEDDNGKVKAPTGLAPSAKWKKSQVSVFSRMKKNLFKKKRHLKKQFPLDTKKFPKKDDIIGWCAFCLGQEQMLKFIQSTAFDDTRENKDDDLNPEGYLPKLSLVLYFTNNTIQAVLSHFVLFLKHLEFSHRLGEWIYAILSVINIPVYPDLCHVLRDIAKACAIVRNQLTNHDEDIVDGLNLIICIIAECFRQRDLADTDNEENTDEEDISSEDSDKESENSSDEELDTDESSSDESPF